MAFAVGAAEVMAGLELIGGAESDLLLEHAENPTAATAAKAIVNVLLRISIIAFRLLVSKAARAAV